LFWGLLAPSLLSVSGSVMKRRNGKKETKGFFVCEQEEESAYGDGAGGLGDAAQKRGPKTLGIPSGNLAGL